MSDTLTVTGVVGTAPRVTTTSNGLHISSFRLATSQRYLDRASGEWRDPGSNWFTVSCFRQLAEHVERSIRKGDRVIVVGRLRLRSWSTESREGLDVEIEAEAVGHDLHWGTATFVRAISAAAAAPEQADAAAGGFVPDAPIEQWPGSSSPQVA